MLWRKIRQERRIRSVGKVGLMEKGMFEQSLEEGQGVNHVAI